MQAGEQAIDHPVDGEPEVLEAFDDGRPKRVKMKVKAAGITDEQIIEYTWSDSGPSWTLISAGAHVRKVPTCGSGTS